MATKKGVQAPAVVGKRAYVSQADIPSSDLQDALRVPRAIAEHYAYKATTPLNVAAALEMQPASSTFRQLTGAAAAYGFTEGGAYADEISIAPLGMRIVRPTAEGDDLLALREALLRPKVVGGFLRKYDGAPLPRTDIGTNVLIGMGVPQDRAGKALEFIIAGAESTGMIRTIKEKRYVDLNSAFREGEIPAAANTSAVETQSERAEPESADDPAELDRDAQLRPQTEGAAFGSRDNLDKQARRVFITHGKNRALLDPIKKLLGFGELEPVVSVETVTVSQPVPDKVIGEMRSCGAAIIHVDAEQTLIDQNADEHVVLNPNVLFEIGAARALFGRRLILLVKEGVSLPSNVQGLFEVRYTGDGLDGEATIRLLEAINDIKNHPMPDRYGASQTGDA